MTSHEISNACFLDILFADRNKSYGAYELRKSYERRLTIALGICFSSVLLSLILIFNNPERPTSHPDFIDNMIRLMDMPKDPLPQVLEQPQPKQRSNAATTRHTNNFQITQDETTVPEQAELAVTAIGTENTDGERSSGLEAAPAEVQTTIEAPPSDNKEKQHFVAVEKAAEFPGGSSAWLAFLNRHLRTPEELQPGERRIVIVRFTVGQDGTISEFQVLQSGGKSFDAQVIRVLKKMPR